MMFHLLSVEDVETLVLRHRYLQRKAASLKPQLFAEDEPRPRGRNRASNGMHTLSLIWRDGKLTHMCVIAAPYEALNQH